MTSIGLNFSGSSNKKSTRKIALIQKRVIEEERSTSLVRQMLLLLMSMALGFASTLNATTINDPTDISNLKAWWDGADASSVFSNTACTTPAAVNGTVACWKDKSGNNAHVTQGTALHRPTFKLNQINGQSALDFDDKPDADRMAHNVADWTGNHTFFIVFRQQTYDSAFSAFFSNDSTQREGSVQISLDSAGNDFALRAEGANGSQAEVQYQAESLDTKLYSYQFKNGKYSTYVDGVFKQTKTVGGNGKVRHYRFNVNRGSNHYTNSLIAEAFYYNKLLSTCENNQVKLYLGNKYGINYLDFSSHYGYSGAFSSSINGIGGIDISCPGPAVVNSASSGILTVSNPSDIQSDDILTFGNNAASLSMVNNAYKKGYAQRLNRIWRFDADDATSGNGGESVGSVTITINAASLGLNMANAQNFGLAISSTATFTNNTTTVIPASSVSGNNIIFNNVNIPNGRMVTLLARKVNPAHAATALLATDAQGVAAVANSGVLRAALVDYNGVAIEGAKVTFGVASGSATITTATGTSNVNGRVFTQVSDLVAETATFTAQYDSTGNGIVDTLISNGSPASVQFAVGPIDAGVGSTLIAATDASGDTDTANSGALQLTLTDAGGNPVPNVAVAFTVASGSATLSAAAGTTNASGQFVTTVSDTVAETATFTAMYDSNSNGTPNAAISNGSPASIVFEAGAVVAGAAGTLIAASDAVADTDIAGSGAVTATLVDGNGNGVPNIAVQFAVASGSASLTNATGVTDSNGQFTSTVSNSIAETATFSAQFDSSGDGNVDTAIANGSPASVVFSAGTVDAANTGTLLQATDASGDTDTANSGALRLTLLDANDNPVPNTAVSFAVASGSASLSTASGTTDANGQFTSTVSDSVAETATFTAQFDSTGNGTPDAVISHGSPASIVFAAGAVNVVNNATLIEATDADGSTDTADSGEVRVTLSDANGNAVANVAVQFALVSGSATINTAAGTTDANGQYSTTVSNAIAETATFNVQFDSNGDGTPDAAVSNGSPASVIFSAGSIDVNAAGTLIEATDANGDTDTANSGALRLTLHDSSDNPVPNVAVSFTVVSGSASLTTATGTTDANGQFITTVSNVVAETATFSAQFDSTGNGTPDTTINNGSPAGVIFVAGAVDVSAPGTLIEATDSAGDTDTANSGAVRVTLLDSNNNPVPNIAVSFAVASGSATLSTASGTTDANGQFSSTVSNAIAETTTFTAQFDSTANGTPDTVISNGSPASVVFTAGSVDNNAAGTLIEATDANGDTDTPDSGALRVTLLDSSNNPVAGVAVSFAVASGSATLNTATGITDANGQYSTTVSNLVAETATFTAQFDSSGNGTADASISNGSPASISFSAGNVSVGNTGTLLQATDADAETSQADSGAIRVTLLDANDNPVSGVAVSFSVASGSATLNTANGTTDANGQYSTTVSNSVAETATFTASFDSSGNGTADTNVSNGSPANVVFNVGTVDAGATGTLIEATDVNGDTDTANSGALRLTLLDSNDNPVPGVAVSFAVASGSATLNSATGSTDANGQFSTTVSNAVAETATFTAQFDSNGNGTPNSSISNGSPASIVFVAGSVDASNSATVLEATDAAADTDVADSGAIRVSLVDSSGNPVAGVAVEFTVASGSATLNSANGITDANGQYSTTVSNTIAETATFTARFDSSGNGSADSAVTHGSPASVVFGAGAVDTGNAGTLMEAPDAAGSTDAAGSASVRVTLLDSNNNPLSGIKVTFARVSGSAQLDQATGTTDANGQYTSTVSDTNTGSSTFSAQFDSNGDNSVDTAVSNGSPASVTFDAGTVDTSRAGTLLEATDASADTDTPNSGAIRVTLLDANNNPVPGVAVAFSVASGSAILTSASGVTDANGQHSSTVSNSIAETATFTVQYDSTGNNAPNSIVSNGSPASVVFSAGDVSAAAAGTKLEATDANGDTDTADSGEIRVSLRDANNNPVPGIAVSFSVASGNATITTANGVTAADGSYSSFVSNDTAETATFTAQFDSDANGVADTNVNNGSPAAVQFLAGSVSASNSATLIVATDAVAEAGIANSGAIRVTLADVQGNPVAGVAVEFSVAQGSATLAAATGLTDANGHFSSAVSNTVAETAQFSARFDINGDGNVDTQVVNGSPANVVFSAGSVDAAHVGTLIGSDDTTGATDIDDSASVFAELKDSHGNPVPGVRVDFTVSGNASFDAASTTTDANGRAEANLSNNVAETVTVSARFDSNADNTVDSDITNGSPQSIVFIAGAVDTGSADTKLEAIDANGDTDTANSGALRVSIVDRNGNAVPNLAVSFAVASGSATLATATGLTDANGQFSTTVSDTVAETATFSVQFDSDADGIADAPVVNGNPASIVFALGAVSAGNGDTLLSSADNQANTAGDTATVTVQLVDANNNPVSGVNVQFANTGNAALAEPNGVTDALGRYTTTVGGSEPETVEVTVQFDASGDGQVDTSVSNGSPLSVEILDKTAPNKPTLTKVEEKSPSGKIVITGTAEPGTSVSVIDPGGKVYPCTPDPIAADGEFTCTLPPITKFPVQVISTDTGGNTSEPLVVEDNTPPPAPLITDTTIVEPNDVKIVATGQPGSKPVVKAEDGSVIDAVCTPDPIAADGTFSCIVKNAVGINLLVTLVDQNGNVSDPSPTFINNDGVEPEEKNKAIETINDDNGIRDIMGLPPTAPLNTEPSFVALFDAPISRKQEDERPVLMSVKNGSTADEACRTQSVASMQEGDEVFPDIADVAPFVIGQDSGFDYPFGLMSYAVVCKEDGQSPLITLLFTGFDKDEYEDNDVSSFVFRKFDHRTGVFSNAPAEVVEWVSVDAPTVGQMRALRVSFRIQDDGRGDEYLADGIDAGIIFDPIGVATPNGNSVRLNKQANKQQASVGDLVEYRINLASNIDEAISGISIADIMPLGFKLLQDSVRIVDGNGVTVKHAVVMNGRNLRFAPTTVPASGNATLIYNAIIGAGVQPGQKINKATALLVNTPVSNEATASVEIVADPIMDRTTLIGKVFNDINANGQQDPGEKGISGARLATVTGEWITVDQLGRYSFPGIDVGDKARGRNFILKLEPASLPEGAVIVSENPRVLRITSGLMNRIDFAVQLAQGSAAAAVSPETSLRLDAAKVFKQHGVLSKEGKQLLRKLAGLMQTEPTRAISIQLNSSDKPMFEKHRKEILTFVSAILGRDASAILRIEHVAFNKFSAHTPQDKPWVQRLGAVLMAIIAAPAYADEPQGLQALCVDTTLCELWSEGESQTVAQNAGSVNLGKGHIWVSASPTETAQQLSVYSHPLAERKNDQLTDNVEFRAFSNFPDFIHHWELELYANSDPELDRPLRVLSGRGSPTGQAITWDGQLDRGKRLSDYDAIHYRLRVFDKFNREANTHTGFLELVTELDELELPNLREQRERATKMAGNRFNLPGGMLRVQAQGLQEGQRLLVSGETLIVDKNGHAQLERHYAPGKYQLPVVLQSPDGEQLQQALLSAELSGQYFFMVGLADMTVSENNVSGSMELLDDNDRNTDDIRVDGRLAFYLKGKIKGRYLITAQMDTGEDEIENIFRDIDRRDPRKLFKRIDPDRYYPVYGDESTITRDVDTQGKFYVRLDWDQNQFLWGNYNTGFTGTELASFNRGLYGAKMDLRSPRATRFGDEKGAVKVFIAEPDTGAAHDEFEGTGGSLYYLRHRDVVLGSAKMSVEVRERDSGLIRENRELTEGVDYTIDEFQGRVILNRPLRSFASKTLLNIIKDDELLDGDAVFLIADYEYVRVATANAADNLTGGVRAKRWFGDHIAAGATLIQEQNGDVDYEKQAVDLTFRATRNSTVTVEYAKSKAAQNIDFNTSLDGGLSFEANSATTAANNDGDAFSVNGTVDLSDFNERFSGRVNAWYRDLDADFSTITYNSTQEGRQRNYGVQGTVELNKKLTSSWRFAQEEIGDSETELAGLQLDYRLTEKVSIASEYRTQSETLGTQAAIDSDIIGLQGRYRANDDLEWYTSLQKVLDSTEAARDGNDLIGFGFDYRVTSKLGVQGEYLHGDAGNATRGGISYQYREDSIAFVNYQVDSSTSNRRMTLGQRSKLSNRLQVYQEHRFDSRFNEDQRGQNYGLDYTLLDGWRVGAEWLDGKVSRDDGSFDRNAYSLTSSYALEDFNLLNRVEYRIDEDAEGKNTQWVTVNNVKLKLNEAFHLLSKLEYSSTENTQQSDETGRYGEFDFGVAYRPVENNALNVLAMYSYLYDLDPVHSNINTQSAASSFDERSHVMSVEGLYQLSPLWELGAKVAWKQGEIREARDQGDFFESSVRLAVVRARYHLMNKWDALVEYRTLEVNEAEDSRSGYLLGVDYHVGRNFKLGVGYNFTQFNDDLTELDYDAKGAFINLIGKM